MLRCLRLLFYFLPFLISSPVWGQLLVTPNQTANAMVDRLVGSGVVYYNPVLTCALDASGKFENGLTTSILIDSGIVLTSGKCQSNLFSTGVNGSAALFASNDNFVLTSDPDLSPIATGGIQDICKLEFDFVPIGDTIEFNYRFGSEEYPSYTCSNFNDIFAFFISGPGYATPTNVALIPGTSCPVSINTINFSTANPCGNVVSPCAPPNNALYVNNSSSATITYDGMTAKLKAIAPVTPCSTYHMKFAIADVFDGILDSGVFLEAGSFTSEAATITSISSTNSLGGSAPFTVEGCLASTVTIRRPNPKPTPQVVGLQYSGTAVSGIDYNTLPATVTIPANDTIVTFTINAIPDGILEGTETILINVYGSACNNTITDSKSVNIFDQPTFGVSNDTAVCAGQSMVLQVSTISSTTGISYSWAGGTNPTSGTTVSVTPATTTTYTVSANYPGCLNIDSLITVSIEPNPTLTLTPVDVSCLNPSGSIQVAATSPSPITFTLLPGGQILTQNPDVFTGLNPGNFTVTATSQIGCTVTGTTSISIAPGLNMSQGAVVNNLCAGGNTGQVSFTTTGGTNPITFTLQPGNVSNTSGSFSGLIAGTYTVTGVDLNGCSSSLQVLITEPTAILPIAVSTTPTLCQGQNTGSASVSYSGGTGTLSYLLLPTNVSNTSGLFNNLNASSYTVQISDANGCSVNTTITVNAPNPISWNAPLTTQPNCFGQNNASLSVQATGGTGTLNYTLTPGGIQNTNGSFSNLLAGNYTVTVADQNLCSTSTVVTITQPSALTWGSISSTIPSCVPGNDASITVNVNGGTTNYQYSIGGSFQPSNQFSGLGAGSYTVTASDFNACSIQTVVVVNGPAAINWVANNANPVTCFGGSNGSIISSASSANGSITYTLLPGSLTGNGNFTSLSAGTYTITANDALGCSINTILNVGSPTAIAFNTVTPTAVLCTGTNTGSLLVNASGGNGTLTYVLNPGNVNNTSGVFQNLSASIYTITTTDPLGCAASTIVTISAPPAMQWNAVNASPIACFGQNNATITASATGGTGSITYTLLPGSQSNTSGSFTGLGTGTYTVQALDQNGCSISTNLLITQPTAVQISNVVTTPLSCVPANNASITISAQGGTPNLQYSIGGPLQNGNVFNGLGAGNYTIVVSDANNCSTTTTTQILTPPGLSWSSAITVPVSCFGGTNGQLQVNATGGTGPVQYVLNPGGASNSTGIFGGLSASSYTVVATDVLGCSIATTLTVAQPTNISWTSAGTTPVSCQGFTNGTINVAAQGGTGSLTYTLNPGNLQNTTGSFSGLGANTYTILVTDANGCSQSTTLTITQPNSIQWVSNTSGNVSCFNGTNAWWNAGASGGSGSLTYTLMPVNLSNTNGQFSNLTAGTYTMTAMDGNQCFITATQLITQPLALSISNVNTTVPTCVPGNDAQLVITASGGSPTYQYGLNGGGLQSSNTFSGLGAGNYTVVVSDINNCTVSSLVIIQSPILLTWASSSSVPVSCFGLNNGQISVSVPNSNGSLSYTLNNPNQTNSIGVFTSLYAGTYIITASDALNCTVSTTVQVASPLPLQFNNMVATNPKCANENTGSAQVNASGGTGTLNYLLTPGSVSNTNGIFNGLFSNNYTIQVSDANGCTATTLFSLLSPNPLNIQSISTTETSCVPNNTGSLSILATGGTPALTYSIGAAFGLSANFVNLVSGTYTATVKDANNCTASSITFIDQKQSPQFVQVSHLDLTCHNQGNGSFSAYAIGPSSIANYHVEPGNLDTNSAVFTNLNGGIYTITATDIYGCSSVTSIDIKNPDALIFTQFDARNPGCDNAQSGSIYSEVQGGTGSIEYTLWPGANTNQNGDYTLLFGKLYTVVATDANGCSISQSAQLQQAICCDDVLLPNAFSPNGDGINDEFRLINAWGIELKKFMVVNRWGNPVFETTNSQFGWNGRHQGELCEIGSYYYLAEYTCPATGKKYLLKGDVMLVR